ncbi:hypothetical protein CKA32_002464 [Geitlerinema sp. FC II]|nr:hypothetical protein CKA32_002464 [Geitlerinema sp. FC II]
MEFKNTVFEFKFCINKYFFKNLKRSIFYIFFEKLYFLKIG